MSSFRKDTYGNFFAEKTAAQRQLFRDYDGANKYFDYIIIGSGMGGGILADDLADRLSASKRILIIEAGSFVYPTHVYNICKFANFEIAQHFAVETFFQNLSGGQFIGEKPQLNFGGRSIFWSGLIPAVQPWELNFFPENVRRDLRDTYLNRAGTIMNESISMGKVTAAIVTYFRNTPLNEDFYIVETPRALHQPYLEPDGTLSDSYFIEPTGVFNTAELLINQVGLTPGNRAPHESGLHIKLNSFVESVNRRDDGAYDVTTIDTVTNQTRTFVAPNAIVAAGSIESPKLIQRSNVYNRLPDVAKDLVGLGLTDHPTTHSTETQVTHIGNIGITNDVHGKIMFYSRGKTEADGSLRYPFNVEMNINSDYWHLRENDPTQDPSTPSNEVKVDIKFSFGNCLENLNVILPHGATDYKSEIKFKDHRIANYLIQDRFPALAGWNKNADEVYAVLNHVTYRILSQFSYHGNEARPTNESWYSPYKNFGYATVHHAIGTLRMPYKPAWNADFQDASVVDEDLMLVNNDGLYVCDMSMLPFSSAANPVRTLGGLALRLSQHLG